MLPDASLIDSSRVQSRVATRATDNRATRENDKVRSGVVCTNGMTTTSGKKGEQNGIFAPKYFLFILACAAIPKMQHPANNTSRDHTARSTTVRDRVNCENGPICVSGQ